jgi:hypothetical protein
MGYTAMKRMLYFGAILFKNGLSLRISLSIKYGSNIIFQQNIYSIEREVRKVC